MADVAAEARPLLQVQGLSKTFPGQRALAGLDLEIRAGEVHALIGQNGSGKSTLIKILAGYHEPDPGGTVSFHQRTGGHHVAFVHQDLALVDALDVVDNLALGAPMVRRGTIDRRAERERAKRALAQVGADIPLDRPVGELKPVERSIVAIARALDGLGDAALLVLDEPTAALPAPEVDRLFEAVRQVTRRGGGVLYVSHRLDEVFRIADRVTVLRDGERVDTVDVVDLNRDALIELMLGHTATTTDAAAPATPVDRLGPPVLSIRSLRGPGIDEFSVDLHPGEVVGVAGLVGSGRELVAGAIIGATPGMNADMVIGGRVHNGRTPRSSLRAGIGFVPADRARCGAILEHSIAENVTLPLLAPLLSRWRIHRGREAAEVGQLCRQLDLRPADPTRQMGTLSGGNQQKAILARWLRIKPRVLIIDEPTQGVDVGAKERIHDLLRAAASEGLAVLVCTAETEDLPELCDRVLVMRRGAIATELQGSQLTVERILVESLDPTTGVAAT